MAKRSARADVILFMTGARAGAKAVMQYLMSGQMGEAIGAKGRV